MKPIIFFDTEIDPKSGKVLDIGAFREPEQSFHSAQISDFIEFLGDAPYLVGHNVFRHDLKYISKAVKYANPNVRIIDTLDLAPLLFPSRPYHHLVKDDKLISDELNNPLNDAIKAMDLFRDEVNAFRKLDPEFQCILYGLLRKAREFEAFFEYIEFDAFPISLNNAIKSTFQNLICDNADLDKFIQQHPAELAYCLALLQAVDQYSIVPRWLNYSRPDIVQVMRLLRSHRCIQGCNYCNQANDAHAGLKSIFGHPSFRTFGGEALQENAVKAALNYDSLLAVFPTGGGKSITFQLPALMQGQQNKGLTVIISPLQSLMKDQVDNLEKVGITSAVTINGLQDPIERSKSFERVSEGLAHLLYISPESLRSPSIEKLIQSRSINRFVIDEAHCFSSWGHDFRVDYLYIGEFINNIQTKRQQETIPVSCFTATAKPQVIDDIRQYFLDKLNITLTIFQSSESRKNLHYKVYEQTEDAGKYSTLRDILTRQQVPSIVYVSRTKRAEDLARKLTEDGLPARPYHGQLDSNIKTKNQDAFLAGDVSIMVATSAFGMGVDKKDIGAVVHYDISDSLENYVQEAGRAGRDEKLQANCYILYDDEDLNKHFILQNNTRLTQKEINQVWKAIKDLTKFRQTISKSALEIAREAGWDDTVGEIETRIKTAIAALEEAGYIKRKNNQSRVYADSLQYKTAQAAIDQINESGVLTEPEKVQAIRIVKSLISSKRKSQLKDDEGETRVEYLADRLGIPLQEVIQIISYLRQEKLLADARDLNAFINTSNPEGRLLNSIKESNAIITHLLHELESGHGTIRLKEIRENILASTRIDVTIRQIRTAIHFMAIKHWIKLKYRDPDKNIVSIESLESIFTLRQKVDVILAIAPFIGKLLIEKALLTESSQDPVLVEFSVLEIKEALMLSGDLQLQDVTREVIEDAIFYLTKIDALTIEGGFLVIYQRLMLKRLEQNTRIQYKAEDYQDLERFYENKIQQVHIVGEYARKMIHDYKGAVQFVEDYFRLNYNSFLKKYFPGRQDVLTKPITPKKFQQIFVGTLSPQQLNIINDKSKNVAVLAGPGSGKTKLLVHKLAASYLMENLKHEQILMLTFSRSAVTEFKKRLYGLIGNAAAFIQIKTFHSYCFDLLGRVGDLHESDNIVRSVITSIQEDRVEKRGTSKLLLLIDEAQDINLDEYELIELLARQNEDMRLILVGDDDQNIYEFRNSSSKFLEAFIHRYKAQRYELLDNYRSEAALVRFTNRFVASIRNRLKTMPIVPVSGMGGEVSIVECNHGPLSVAVAEKVAKAELSGTTAVLCPSNQEAAEINSMLRKHNINARLIQSSEGFDLINMVEVRAFIDFIKEGSEVTILKEQWAEAKGKCKHLYQRSQWWSLMQRLWKDFEDANQKTMYVSDLIAFVRESNLEDFIYEQSGVVMISTYHKSKGREFDNVFVTITRPPVKDDEKRALYVAMTRAKHKLIILSNGDFLKPISREVAYSVDTTPYKRSEELSYALTHEDVNLGHFESKQVHIKTLIAGDALQVNEDGCKDKAGNFVVRFSKKFQQTILGQKKTGYVLKAEGLVNFIVYWRVEDGDEEKIVLPEVVFEMA